MLGEGATPLIPLPSLGGAIGVPKLHGKLEPVNPTGSYKDRIAAASMTEARRQGRLGWIATSSGNAAAAMAAYGARAGLPGLLLVQASIPREKLLPALACGATVIKVSGVGRGATAGTESVLFGAVQRAADEHDLFLAVTAHAFNPIGMQGADGLGHELAVAGSWDAVYVPAGGGGLAVAVGRGLRARGRGAALVVVQPAGCAPIVSFLAGERDEPRIDRCLSVVSALQLPAPPDGMLAAEAVRAVDGWGTAVRDEDIWAAQRELATHEGVFVEPAAAAPVAAMAEDRRSGRLSGSACAVAVLTGSGSKDLSAAENILQPPPEVEVDELPRHIAAWHGRMSPA